MDDNSVGIALGGLAGANAFGAGVLEAAHQAGVRPAMISVTSGQIAWLRAYLHRLDGGPSLREVLGSAIDQVEPTGNRNLDLARMMLLGVPGVFRPAIPEYWVDWATNWLGAARNTLACGGRALVVEELLSVLPARVLVPTFPQGYFADIADAFNASDIGIVFNSYNPREGLEYVHLNNAARRIHDPEPGSGSHDPGSPSGYRERTVYQGITAQSVQDGLWLYEYGFEQQADFLDGAYFRDVMLAELHPVSRIIAARPMSFRWRQPLPRNYIGVQDLKTKVSFNGAYAGERDQLMLINSLIAAGDLNPQRYHEVDLVELEPTDERGFFGYTFEDVSTFDDGFHQAAAAFRSAVPAPARPASAQRPVRKCRVSSSPS